MKKLVTLFFILSCFFTSFGAYLENIPIRLTQPDGEVLNLFITGDEFYRIVHDSDGYSIVCGADGWYYYALYDAVNDKLVSSEFRVSAFRNFELPMDKMLGISQKKYIEIRRAYFEPTGCNPSGASAKSLLKDLKDSKTTQQINNIVICVGFSDTQGMTNNYTYVDGLFNSNPDNNMRDFFSTMSYNKIDVQSHFYPPANGAALRFYQDPHPRNYYEPYSTANPIGYDDEDESAEREWALLANAVDWVNTNWPIPTSLDLDVNNDGDCDFISFVIYGEPGAWNSLLWPHKWSLYGNNVYINGKRVWDYNFELDGSTTYFSSNVFCHEGYHVLGAPDLYHYYSYTDRKAVNTWDIMDYNYLTKPQSMSAYMKYKYGNWVPSLPVASINQTYEVYPFYYYDGTDSTKPVIYRIPMTSTTTQYSVVEYRKKNGTNYDLYLPNEGLLIYRINANFDGNAMFDGVSEFDEVFLYRPNSTQNGGVYTNGNLEQAPFNPINGRTAFNSTTNPKPCQSNGVIENNQNINNILYDSETDSYTFFYGDPANRTISVNTTELILESYAGVTGAVNVFSNVVWYVSIPASATGWLSVSNTKMLNNGTLIFTALTSNTTGAPRNANVTITGNGQTLNVNIIQNAEEDPCVIFENFENISPANPGYLGSIITSPNGEWLILGYGIMTNDDRRIDDKSIRLRANNSDTATHSLVGVTGANVIQMHFDKPNGVGEVSFYYGSFGAHSGGKLYVQYSTDAGTTWNSPANNSVTSPAWNTVNEMQLFTVPIYVDGDVRIRIIKYKQSGTQNSVNVDNICITDYIDLNTVAIPTFNPPGGNYITLQSVTINCATTDRIIHYTTDGSTPTVSSPVYSSPIPLSTITTLKAMAVKSNMNNSPIATAIYNFPIEVANIAAFKAANSPNATSYTYKITGNVTFVFRSGQNIYIKDASGGLLIFDDTTPVITTEYNEGDVISGGIIGTCTIYNGQYALIPTVNTAPGVSGMPVTPMGVTMTNLLANFATYESQLIRLENITFGAGTFATGAAANIPIYQGNEQMICRNHFGTITGYETDPELTFHLIGFAIPYNTDRQIAPRKLEDIIEIDGFVSVENIINVPAKTAVGVPLTLTGMVLPIDATFQTIHWSVKEGGTTGATITGNTLNTTNTGMAIILATIIDGINFGTNYTQEFSILAVDSLTTYIITATVNNPNFGAINPAGEISVEEGGAVTFIITPFENYKISDVRVNGISKGTITTYKFENVLSDGTIEAIFETVGIENHELANIKVYSHQNTIYIMNETHLTLREVEIFDITGKMIYKSTMNNVEKRITLQVPSGIYFVRLTSQEGVMIIKKALISCIF